MRFMNHGAELKFVAKDTILTPGVSDNHIYYILSGEISSTLSSANKELFSEVLSAGSLFGVVNNFIAKGKQMLHVTAVTDVTLYVWEKLVFVDAIQTYQELARQTILDLSRHLRFLNQIIAVQQDQQ